MKPRLHIQPFSLRNSRLRFMQLPLSPNPLCLRCRRQQLRFLSNRQLADDSRWVSVVDNPPQIVRTGKKHGPGLIILALIPITAFLLGTWQVQRLDWKTKLIAKFEDRLVQPPLPLPPRIDPNVISEFDYRRVCVKGHLRHDQEMLIGPRMHDGEEGFLVVTPLERGGGESTVLVNRGWIPKKMRNQNDRLLGLPEDDVVVEGLLREPFKKNMFTPENRPKEGRFYFPDVLEMAALTGSQPVWIEETMVPDLVNAFDRKSKGIPIGRPPQVHLRNNHAQYIFTCRSVGRGLSSLTMFC
ncbi:hypothetical protein Egran_02578 [Elaphomyces granulatus]|uniref:SURF1-like protein n=1 Tax=Elaphomyces granulatus TaxID=519963 RepID=A0A232M039_9EURO|nr:hypothetical protein Egran_02578 [Elaphomyces granulatus]